MTRFVWLVLLLAGAALAQPVVTRGGALKKRQYQTYGAMTLYVDPTGSDSSACTSSGTGACATINGALSKVPRFVKHDVTINVAAGTYSGVTEVSGFYFVPTGGVGHVMTIQGSWANARLATGAATGTITSSATGSTTAPMTFSTVTDSGQSWTPGALKGLYIAPTSGAGVGQYRVIVDNTATTLSLNSALSTNFNVGTTYAIQKPASVVDTLNVSGNTLTQGPGLLGSLTIVALAVTGNAAFDSNSGPPVGVLLRQMHVSGTLSIRRSGAIGSSSTNYFQGLSVGVGVNGTGFFQDNGGYIKGLITLSGGTFAHANATNQTITVVENTTASATLLTTIGGYNAYGVPSVTSHNAPNTTGSSRLWLLCSSTGQTGITANGLWTAMNFGLLNITNCTNGVILSNGMRVQGQTSGWTFSGVTNELSVDGTVYPLSYLNGLSPKTIMTPQGSALLGY